MKGLKYIPQKKLLEEAYQILLHSNNANEQDLALYSQWARFDARLAEILVKYIYENWTQINSVTLNIEIRKQPWPAAIAVLLEFVTHKVVQNKSLWNCWKKTAVNQIQKAEFEQFFIGWTKIAGQTMLENAQTPMREYLKWGYLSREILFNKAQNKTHTFTAAVRKNILIEMLKLHKKITVNDYLSKLNFAITKRTAERDLAQLKGIKKIGVTKGAFYIYR